MEKIKIVLLLCCCIAVNNLFFHVTGSHAQNGVSSAIYVLLQNGGQTCSAVSRSSCSAREDCEADGVDGFWYDDQCNGEAQAACSATALASCTGQTGCQDVGGYWYQGVCKEIVLDHCMD